MTDNEKKKVEQELKDLNITLEKTVDTVMSDDPSVEKSVMAGVHCLNCGQYTSCGQLVVDRK